MLAKCAAGLALACAGVAFLGWVADVPALRHFGIGIPIWPMTAIGFAALAAGQLALLHGRRAAALACFAVPVFLGIVGIGEALTGYDTGLHQALFAQQLARTESARPGLPGHMVVLQWVLLIGATLLASRQTWRDCLAACIVANIPLALAIMTIALTTAAIRIVSGPANFLWASFPASLATLLLCLSVFFWCRANSVRTHRADDLAGWTFVRVFPLVLLVPGLTWLLELVALTRGVGARWLETIAVGLNMVLVAGLLAWAIYRMSRQQALIRAIVDTMPDAMIAFDQQGIIRRFSPGAVRMLGFQPVDVIGRHFSTIVAESRRANAASLLDRYLETGIPQVMGRVTRTFAVRQDGTEIPVEQRIAEMVTGGERLFIWFLRDLTETIASEDRLGSLAAELGHVARLSAMGEMAAGMAHELNQPLTAIANYTGAARMLMDQNGDPGRVHALVDSANKQTLRAGQIIRRMREFASKGQVDMEIVSVTETIHDAVALVFVGPMPLDITLDYDLDPRAETMFADRIQIQQVLVNLLRNTVQAMQRASSARKEIVISTRLRGNEMMEIGVSDTGPGIPPALRTALFAPFTASSNKGGMGVGLSICRRIVEAHGGEIGYEDRKGGGAVFRFTVPTAVEGEETEG